MPGPNRLSKTGWNKDSLKPQDEITITGNPTKDGSKSIRLGKVVLPTVKNSSDVPAEPFPRSLR